MEVRYLKKIALKKAIKQKQDNGSYIDTYVIDSTYQVQTQELNDNISSSIYGANINKMLRIKSPNATLEKYLKTKVNNKQDNITKYFVFIDDVQYSITSVRHSWVDIERY